LTELIVALRNFTNAPEYDCTLFLVYRGADTSLARPERKQATATEDFDVHISDL